MKRALAAATLACVCLGAAAKEKKEEQAALDKARLLVYEFENGSTRSAASAAKELSSLPAPIIMKAGVLDALSQAVTSEAVPYSVKEAAVKALSNMAPSLSDNGKAAVKKTLSKLATDKDQNDNLRVEAIDTLSKMLDSENYDDRRIIDSIMRLSSSTGESDQIRNVVNRFEIIVKGRGNVSGILKSLESPGAPAQTQRKAMETLKLWIAAQAKQGGGLTGTDAAKLLTWARQNARPPEVRKDMLYVVAQVAKSGVKVPGVPGMLEKIALEDSDPSVQEAAVKALGISGDPGAIKTLVKLYGNSKGDGADKERLRAAACEALGEFFPVVAAKGNYKKYSLHVRNAVKTLTDALNNDPSAQVCVAAATALGNMSMPKFDRYEAAKALVAALYDEDSKVVEACYTALKAISGRDFGKDGVKDWEDWLRSNRNSLKGLR